VSSKIKATPASHHVRLIETVADRPRVVERTGEHLVHRRLGLEVVAAVCRRAATHAAVVTTEAAGAQPSHDVNIPTRALLTLRMSLRTSSAIIYR
jgi:hypothetical protein